MPLTTIQESGTNVIGGSTVIVQRLHPRVAAFINLLSSNSVSLTTTQINALNNFYWGMVANGLDTKMSAVYPFIGGTATSNKFNLMDARDLDAAFRLNFVGGWTHAATGSTSNGTTGYANTFLLANTFTYTNNHLSFYSRTSGAGSSVETTMGSGPSTSGANWLSLFSRRSTNLGGYDSGSATANRASGTLASGSTLFLGTSNSTTGRFYRNGVLVGSNANLSATNSANAIFLGAFNVAGTPNYFAAREFSFASIGIGLTETESLIFNTLVVAYQTALSRNV
jgi:hypothetical protein